MTNETNIRTVYAQNVHIGPIHAIHDFIEFDAYSKLFVIVDENTKEHCLGPFMEALQRDVFLIETVSGEFNKTLETCHRVWSLLLESQADRKSLVINLGGGVLGDLGGFCAATFMRGMDFIQVPTTVLAMADASVGGKLGVDFQHKKNYIGLFQKPKLVWIDPVFLNTLNHRQIWNGTAEIYKHGLISDRALFDQLVQVQIQHQIDWADILHRSVYIKSEIVQRDQFEHGERKKLNFGHTVGHAVESAFLKHDLDLLHGEAIVVGMIAESYIAYRLGILHEQDLTVVEEGLRLRYPHVDLDQVPMQTIIDLVQFDKKKQGDEVMFTLIDAVGRGVIDQIVPVYLVEESLNYYNKR